MPLDILLTVVVTAAIQSIFGVGVLLFGTPLLLLFGYDFTNSLMVLLPISIAINSFQILKHYRHIDSRFFRNVLIYAIPFVVLFLFIVTSARINIGLLVGLFLLLVASKSYSTVIDKALLTMIKHERIYLAVMGVVHGMTNLGGSLLTAVVHGKNYPKDVTRVTVAICYATFAVFQIITLLLLGSDFTISYADNMAFLKVGVIVFLFTEEMLYAKIDNEKYTKIFALFLFASGILLVLKSV